MRQWKAGIQMVIKVVRRTDSLLSISFALLALNLFLLQYFPNDK